MKNLNELAADARPIDEADYGTSRQIEAENRFYEALASCLTLEQALAFADFCLKATTIERLAEGLRLAREADNTKAALDLLRELAALTIDGDVVDGEEYLADGNDDEIDALYDFVRRAREILGEKEG